MTALAIVLPETPNKPLNPYSGLGYGAYGLWFSFTATA